jgi:stage II sporulation protein R
MESGDALPAQEQGRMTASASAAPSASPEPLEVRFFLLDTFEKVFSGWKD